MRLTEREALLNVLDAYHRRTSLLIQLAAAPTPEVRNKQLQALDEVDVDIEEARDDFMEAED